MEEVCRSLVVVLALCAAVGQCHLIRKNLISESKYIEEEEGFVDENSLLKQRKNVAEVDTVDFIGTRVSRLGELELRIQKHGIKAMETQIPGMGEAGLFLREVTDGRRFVQAIYKDKAHLVDCDIDSNAEDITKFVDKFFGQEGSNKTMRVIEAGEELDPVYKSMVDFRPQIQACRAFHKQLRQFQREKRQEARLAKNTVGGAGKEKFEESEKKSAGRRVSKVRSKRSMWNGNYIYPGTNWCGNGNVAGGFDDLGENIATDKCCRSHDHCPYVIEGFTTKYNMFNYRFHTLSHCTCDELFFQCLKGASNTVADMVGSLYFNTLSTKCFMLKAERSCVQRSWWGKCVEYERSYAAEVQEPLVY